MRCRPERTCERVREALAERGTRYFHTVSSLRMASTRWRGVTRSEAYSIIPLPYTRVHASFTILSSMARWHLNARTEIFSVACDQSVYVSKTQWTMCECDTDSSGIPLRHESATPRRQQHLRQCAQRGTVLHTGEHRATDRFIHTLICMNVSFSSSDAQTR